MRALALMRIGVALVVITDLVFRASDISAFYTDEGIWPVRLMYSIGWNDAFWSLHALNGGYWWQIALFSLHAIAAVLLLVGYNTRIATAVTWLLLISLHNRNLFILQSGDDLLRLTLLWGIFLPWNARYAIDSLKKGLAYSPNFPAYAGYLLLIASVYLFSALMKTGKDWHDNHDAVYFALSLEQLRLPVGDLVYNYPGLMRAFTYLVYFGELTIPFLILIPQTRGYLRLTAFLLIVILHAGIGLTLYVGLFYIINMVCAIGLLPSVATGWIDRLIKSGKKIIPLIYSTGPLLRWTNLSVCVIIALLCMILNLESLQVFPYQLRKEFRLVTSFIKLDQYWGMFAPEVLKKDGWYVYEGTNKFDETWDLGINRKYVDYTKPSRIAAMYSSDRWRKMAENMQGDNCTFLRPRYCDFYLKRWNEEHPERRMVSLNIYFMEKENLSSYRSSPVNRELISVCNEK